MILKKPKFWKNVNIISILLLPLSIITLIISELKKFLSKKKLSIKSICVGNINVGGTGKTSMALAINKILKHKCKTVVIKKKYSNQLDEQLLIKSKASLICSETRSTALNIAKKKGFDLAILDDGLQEKKIIHDLSIVCFNSSEGIGNSFLLPAGPLRESLRSVISYDAIIMCGEKKNTRLVSKLRKINNNLKFFYAKYIPNNLNKINRKKEYLVFSGLGNPEEFDRTLKRYKFKIKKKIVYPDHYKLSINEIKNLRVLAKKQNLSILTTEKDYYRIEKKLRKHIHFLSIELKFKNSKIFSNFITSVL